MTMLRGLCERTLRVQLKTFQNGQEPLTELVFNCKGFPTANKEVVWRCQLFFLKTLREKLGEQAFLLTSMATIDAKR